jgi:hypothetical protein
MNKKALKKTDNSTWKSLDPNKSHERREIIRQAVDRTIKEYGKALEKLGNE